ncbi:PQQ-binding-like beta-propeller repeat protein [Saccharibacillus sacchari]|uniref:outer membrane protein assembly factor BamB family protein n=1 Tax=Saccharibacillus sacchari TaxID=456493 RepID=UPI0004B87BED|nr:PQQ-binding-like beta-propeller repeat protein [Saccharibacillus sacchari]
MHIIHTEKKFRRFTVTLLIAGLLIVSPIPGGRNSGHFAQAAAPDSATTEAATSRAPAVIETVDLQASAPILRYRPTAAANWRNLIAHDYWAEDSEVKVLDREGDWLRVKQNGDNGWIPTWYAEAKSDRIETLPAVRLTPSSTAKLHASPDSEAAWVYDGAPSISMLRFGDWYGVSPYSGRTAGKTDSHAMLLWLHADDVTESVALERGLLAADSDLSMNTLRAALDGQLRAGVDAETVRSLLGEPFSAMDAPMLYPNDLGEDGRYHWKNDGTEWRYELPGAHLLVHISEQDRLIGLNWVLPLTAYDQQLLQSAWLEEADFDALYQKLPILPSLSVDFDWRTRVDTNYAYSVYANDDTLLVYSDDEGFSGFHYSSLLYAMDRKDGSVRWKYDAGYSGFRFFPNSTGESVTIDNYGATGDGQNKGTLAHLRLSDGKVLWTYDWPGLVRPSAYAAGDSILLLSDAAKRGDDGVLIALDEKTGKKRWKKQVSPPYDLVNRGSDDPYVLLSQGGTLQALDPLTGEKVWSVASDKGRIDSGESLVYDPNTSPALTETDGTRWIKFDGEDWRKIDTISGQTLARYAAEENDAVEELGGGYLLVQHETDTRNLRNPYVRDYETSLIEASSGDVLWTRSDLMQSGMVDGDTLYAVINRIPAAVDLKTGVTLWEARTNGMYPNSEFRFGVGPFARLGDYLLLPYDRDLLAFDKKTGRQLGRIDGLRFGYPETQERLSLQSLLNEKDGKLYIGSASRALAVLDVGKLTEVLDEAVASGRGIAAVTPAMRAAENSAWYPAQTQ